MGVDTAVFFTSHSGIGLLVQYSGATVDLPSVGHGLTNVSVGVIQSGAGLRLRF